MRRFFFVTTLVLALAVAAHPAFADVWLDAVISFDQPDGSSQSWGDPTLGDPIWNDPTMALGEDDGRWVSIDIPETLILAFTDNTAFNGDGFDLRILELKYDGTRADVYGSKDGSNWFFLGQTNGGVYVNGRGYSFLDLGELSYVNYLKFVGLDDKGGTPGFDLDSVKALHSGPHVPIPAAILLFGSGLIGLAGMRMWPKK